jgi:hypothetical protein
MLTDNQVELIHYALGSNDPQRQYRNFFIAAQGMPSYQDLMILVSKGYMEKTSPLDNQYLAPDHVLLMVTEKGKNYRP